MVIINDSSFKRVVADGRRIIFVNLRRRS